jgi:hypothetical protein
VGHASDESEAAADGIDVTLLWDKTTNRVSVAGAGRLST